MGLFTPMCSVTLAGIQYTTAAHSQVLPMCQYNSGISECFDQNFIENAQFDKFLVVLTTEGGGWAEMEDARAECAKGDALLIDCRNDFRVKPREDGIWRVKWLHVTADEYEAAFRQTKNKTLCVIRLSDETQVDGLLSGIDATIARRDDEQRDLRLYLMTNDLFTTLIKSIRASAQRKLSSQGRDMANAAQEYIQAHYMDNLTNNELANMFYMSEYYFIRQFKRFAGVTPHEYLLSCRMNVARRMLANTSLPVTAVAREIGFTGVNNFNRAFKLKWSVSPGEYRKRLSAE